MSYRYMRMMVMFDLPTDTNNEKREYRRFRKHLLRSGFFMLQESIYTKIFLNQTAANAMADNLEKVKPSGGFVIALMITEKQFEKMKILTGKIRTNVLHSDERLVFL